MYIVPDLHSLIICTTFIFIYIYMHTLFKKIPVHLILQYPYYEFGYTKSGFGL